MFRSNAKQFAAGIRKVPAKFRDSARTRVVKAARFVHHGLIDKTPVWEGKTVRNYIMTVGTTFSGVYEAINNGPTGQTNNLSLGAEPRRGPNATAALATGSSLTEANALSKINITNNSDSVAGLETGELPGNGKTSRSPQGMFALTLQEVSSRLRSKSF